MRGLPVYRLRASSQVRRHIRMMRARHPCGIPRIEGIVAFLHKPHRLRRTPDSACLRVQREIGRARQPSDCHQAVRRSRWGCRAHASESNRRCAPTVRYWHPPDAGPADKHGVIGRADELGCDRGFGRPVKLDDAVLEPVPLGGKLPLRVLHSGSKRLRCHAFGTFGAVKSIPAGFRPIKKLRFMEVVPGPRHVGVQRARRAELHGDSSSGIALCARTHKGAFYGNGHAASAGPIGSFQRIHLVLRTANLDENLVALEWRRSA